MKCKKCGSGNLTIIKSGKHEKLVCKDCFSFVTFLNKEQAFNFKEIKKIWYPS